MCELTWSSLSRIVSLDGLTPLLHCLQSFQRNCNLWGFRTASKGPTKGQCSHANFIRGNLDACRTMKVVRNKTFPEQTHPSSVSSLSAPIQSCTSIGQQPVFGNTGMAVSGMSDSMNSANAAGNLGRLDLTKISQLLAQNQGGGAMQAPAAHSMSSNGNGNAAANPTMLSALLSMATGGNNSNLAPPPQLQQTQQQQPPLVQSLAALLPALNGQPQPSQQQVQQQRPPNGVADLLALLRGNKPSEVHFSATAAAPAS